MDERIPLKITVKKWETIKIVWQTQSKDYEINE